MEYSLTNLMPSSFSLDVIPIKFSIGQFLIGFLVFIQLNVDGLTDVGICCYILAIDPTIRINMVIHVAAIPFRDEWCIDMGEHPGVIIYQVASGVLRELGLVILDCRIIIIRRSRVIDSA